MPESGRIRVIAGSAKGRTLKVPPGTDIRPTLDRVREALFSILGPALAGARFLDLYAGSGANGIEALSRGAAFVQFIEAEPRAVDCITENLARAGLAGRALVSRSVLPGQLGRVAAKPGFDFVFADPPYALDAYAATVQAVVEAGVLLPDGWLVLEHPSKREAAEFAADPLVLRRTYRYGESALSVFEHQK